MEYEHEIHKSIQSNSIRPKVEAFISNATKQRLERSAGEKLQRGSARFTRDSWEKFPTQSPVCDRNDGISDRLVGITFSRWRKEAIKMLGNSIVPQVAIQIFKAIESYENLK